MPAEKLLPDGNYLYFSHITKGQPYNMPMLQRLLDLNCTLLDYEQIADDDGRRLIFFGQHAGYAGMIDALWALGQRLLVEGHQTPFAALRPAYEYDSLEQALDHVGRIGERLARDGVPSALQPLICGFTGTGNVSLGAQAVLDRLPVTTVAAEELERLVRNGSSDNVVYQVVFDLDERFVRDGGGAVTLEELSRHPERFGNRMLEWLPALTVLVNGMFWTAALPRLLPLDAMRSMVAAGELDRLRVIADIACDVDGAIEATVKATTPDNPAYVYDVARGAAVDGFEGRGPVILAVDNLPAELPRESSRDFGDTLVAFAPALARCDWSRPLEELDLPPELARAIIVHRGRLTSSFAHLEAHLPG